MSKQLGIHLNVTASIPDDGDVYIISVGTPVEKNKKGNMSPNIKILKDLAKKLLRKSRGI